MDQTNQVARFIAKSVPPVACSELVMDMDRHAWTMALEYLSSSLATSALEEQLGPSDSQLIFGIAKRWSFAGTTIEQRGRVVTIAEPF